jgi:Uma2 family endonuclease
VVRAAAESNCDDRTRLRRAGKDRRPMAVSLKIPLVVVDDADLVRVSRENPGYQFEREEDGTLTVSPNFTRGGAQSGVAYSQLLTFAMSAGGEAFDSSSGFKIGRRGAVKSPDASWVSQPRIDTLTEEELAGFWPLSPDVAIEVRSATDDFKDTVAKIRFYRRNGTRYAVAIDPQTREIVERGSPPPGLVLDVEAIIDA